MQMSNGNVQILYMSLTECNSSTTQKLPIWSSYYNWDNKYYSYFQQLAIQWAVYLVTCVQVLSDTVVMFLSSIVVLTTNGTFWVVPVLYLVSDVYISDTTSSSKQNPVVSQGTSVNFCPNIMFDP